MRSLLLKFIIGRRTIFVHTVKVSLSVSDCGNTDLNVLFGVLNGTVE